MLTVQLEAHPEVARKVGQTELSRNDCRKPLTAGVAEEFFLVEHKKRNKGDARGTLTHRWRRGATVRCATVRRGATRRDATRRDALPHCNPKKMSYFGEQKACAKQQLTRLEAPASQMASSRE